MQVKKGAGILIAALAGIASGAVLLSGAWSGASERPADVHGAVDSPSHMPLDVLTVFGDREKRYDALGPNYVYIDESFVDSDNNCDFCFGIKYDGGPHEKAFVGFRSSEPVDLSQTDTLVFDARGESGGELVTVYAVGKKGESTDDIVGIDFAFSKQIALDKEWKMYQLDLEGYDLSEITHGFAFEVPKGPGTGSQIVYFDNIYYDTQKSEYAIDLN